MDRQDETPRPDDTAIEAEERVERLTSLASDVVLVLVKTLKATGIYQPNNPIYKKFRDEMSLRFGAYFAEEDRLSLRVGRFELKFMDRVVYENPDKESNIALMFFKDGVREICFHNGIDDSEISGLMELLQFNAEERALDDDLVTLMWEKDFRHITYTVVEDSTTDDAAVEEAILSFEEEPEAIRQIEGLRELARKHAARQAGAGADAAGHAGQPAAEAAGASFGALEDSGDGRDYEAIRGTYPAPDDVALLTELTDIFYEIMVTETDMGRFGMVAGSLAKALDIFVSRGDLALATVLVMKVQELAGYGKLSDEALAMVDGVLARAASEPLVKKVGQYIEETGTGALEAAGSYLGQLDERAVDPIVTLLESMSDRRARRAVCDLVPVITRGSSRTLVPHLRHRIWYVARNVAMMLGKIGDPEAVRPLGGALRHAEPRVRREALGALAAIGGGEAAGLIESALGDEARAVRLVAARLLAELDPEKTFTRLTELAAGKEFRGREFEEKREVMELIGRTGGARSVGFLSELFKKKGLFGGGSDEMRACAAYGLGAAGGAEALELLRSEAGSRHKQLRAACAEGIRRIETRRA